MILVTGAKGLLGRYVVSQFEDKDIITLGRGKDNSISYDLTAGIPVLQFNDSEKRLSLVVHCAGGEEEKDIDLNEKGTLNLLKALEKNIPEYFVYISSYQVYSEDAGENLNEETHPWATSAAGQSKARTEIQLKEWAARNNVTLTIIRPAKMFGNGVHGDTLRLFNEAVRGSYMHIRGNDARISVVTALDVAKGIKNVYRKGGVYNAADNTNPRLIELVESMSANIGGKKRMTHLPLKWAEWIWRFGAFIPAVKRNLAPEVVTARMKSLTLDGSRFSREAGINYFNTLQVIERIDAEYPYDNGSVTDFENHVEA